ncbi:MAG: GxxExxY protein [Candidatus Sedimenticola sp. (ex Thyasira tokunagai)]
MNANERKFIDETARKVIGAAYEVSNHLGSGFLEKVYERALAQELNAQGIKQKTQVPMTVSYKGQDIGNYVADMLVEERLLVELKCVDAFSDQHIAQCLNYLKASGFNICLLINFQKPRVEWRRVVNNF